MEALESRALFSSVPSGFTITTAAKGLDQTTSMVDLPDGRLLITQRTGAIRVIKNGQVLATPALNLTVDSTGERGLLGIDIDPHFSTDHYIYVQWVPSGQTQVSAEISRFTMSGDTASLSSQKLLLKLDPEVASSSHAAGAIHFGTDGKLYIAVGDNEVPTDSQSLTTTHGKLLRINADGSIPTDNPFYTKTTGIERAIYAIGLRNPFSFAVNPTNGTMYVNDVGAKAYEEIDQVKAGANYGWPNSEGPTTNPAYTTPVFAYAHVNGASACIAGGVFYSGVKQQFPTAYAGDYFYGDYSQGFIDAFNPTTGKATAFATGLGKVIDLAVSSDGTLQCLTYDGNLFTIHYTAPGASTASITGTVVDDTNGNGVWNSGEVGITGRSVWLDLNNDGKEEADEPIVKTTSGGKFTFSDLAAGTYKVREVIPSGWKQTLPTNGYGINTTVTTGQALTIKPFLVTTA